MVYTEVKVKNGKKYYYRVRSKRVGKSFSKDRIYLGVDLSGSELKIKSVSADKKLLSDKINSEFEILKSKIISVLKKNNVKRASLFGSYARGEQVKTSDIDILIEPPKDIGFGFVGIAYELEDKLGKKVDLVSYNGISPYFKKSIMEDEIRIL